MPYSCKHMSTVAVQGLKYNINIYHQTDCVKQRYTLNNTKLSEQ